MQEFSISISLLENRSLFQRIRWFLKKKAFAVSMPESWNEVAPELIPAICREIMNRDKDGKESSALNIFKLLSKLPDYVFLNIQPVVFVEQLLPLIDWTFETIIDKPYLNTITHSNIEYHLPGPELDNITWKEYTQADQRYIDMINNPSEEALNNLVAILLREKSNDKNHIIKTSDSRIPLTEWGSEKRAKIFNELDDDVKFYVMYFFMSCKELIHDKYKTAWDDKEKENTTSEEDWDSISTDIAESSVFGNLQELEQTNAHKILKWLSVKRKRAMKAQHKSLQEQIMANHKSLTNANS